MESFSVSIDEGKLHSMFVAELSDSETYAGGCSCDKGCGSCSKNWI